MWKIEGREKSDNPALIAWDRHLNNFDTKKYVQNSWASSANSPKTIGFDDSDTYIRGVAVCLNKSKTKLKGVKIWGAKVNRNNGVLNTISTPKKWERTNCKHWGEAKYCPGGKIATGPSGAGRAIGIALECRKVGIAARSVIEQSRRL